MNFIHFPLLLVLLHAKGLLQFAAATDNVAAMGEAIGRMESELATLTNQSATVLQRIDGLAKGGIKLMHILSPVTKFALGPLLEAMFKKPESSEHKAIVQLGKQMLRGFKHLEVHISQKFDEFECQGVADTYDDKVVFKLKLLYQKFEAIFTEPTNEAELQQTLDRFTTACRTKLDLLPIKIMKFIAQKIRENCHLSDLSPLEPGCKDIDGEQQNSSCYLKAYRDGNQYKREPLLAFIDQIGRDMLKLELTAAFCIFHSANYSDHSREKSLHEVGTYVKKISEHMKMWVETNLDASWPETITKYAIDQNERLREEIIKKAIEGDNTGLLNEIAESIAGEARARGPIGFNYHAHLWSSHVPHWLIGGGAVEVKAWAAICTNEYFCQKLHREGADIVLYRYQDDEITANFVERQAKKWIEANGERIRNILLRTRPSAHFDDELAKIYAHFPEIGNLFGGAILMDHIGSVLSPGEGQSSNAPSTFVHDPRFAIEYRENPSAQPLPGAMVFVHKKLVFFLGDWPLSFVQNLANVPKSVTIVGTPKRHNPRQFEINLKRGDGEILLHFNPRFNAEYTKNAVVLNSWGKYEQHWFEEERASEFPFHPGKKFSLKFETKQNAMRYGEGPAVAVDIILDDKHFYKFVYRNEMAGYYRGEITLGFNILEIKGDLELDTAIAH